MTSIKFSPLLLVLSIAVVLRAAEPAPSAWKFDLTALTAHDTFTPARGSGFDLGPAPGADSRPFYFSVAVPEGNYRVSVTFGDARSASSNTVKAETRRLMLESVATKPGERVTRSFIVNVRNSLLPPPPKNAPGGSAVVLNERDAPLSWDDKLTLEFNGSAPRVSTVAIERATVPTVFLAGDSTVCDQRAEPDASWGQMLPRFFSPTVAIANHATSGETLKSFISGLRLAKLLSQLKSGDYLFIQFGHNDEKKSWPQTYVEAHTTYPAYLRVFIAEARLRGAIPVLVTPMPRRVFDTKGKIQNTHGDYPQAVRDLAATEQIAVIDLDRLGTVLFEALGPEKSRRAFANGGRDPTHHSNYGAYELAKCVAQGIRDARLPIAKELSSDFGGFDPAHPDDPDAFVWAASRQQGEVAPTNR